MAERYQLSKYVKKFDQKTNYSAFFSGLTLKKVYGTIETLDSAFKKINLPYEIGDDSTVDSLIENGFFVRVGDDETKFNTIRNSVGGVNISNIVMIVANDCNLRCTYCQIEENMGDEQRQDITKRPLNMSIETAKKALDLYEANSLEAIKRTISITGGEPLMNIPTVKYILERTKDMDNARAIIFTNGALVTEPLADYFSKSKALMLVSLDGPEDIHNTVRKKVGGQGSFEASVKGYKKLRDAGCKVGISAVTGIHNKERMDEVRKFFSSLKPPSIGLNYGHHLLEEGKPNPSIIGMNEFAKILTESYQQMRSENIFIENISRFVTPFYLEQPRINECQAEGKGFTVDSRGLVGVCKSLLVSDHISFPLDEISEPISELPVFKEWSKRSPFTLEECVECEIIGICGGGCTYDSYAINQGDISKIDPRICEYTERVAEFLIWDLFQGINVKEKLSEEKIYIPNLDEQEMFFLGRYEPTNQLQRSVGHEKDN